MAILKNISRLNIKGSERFQMVIQLFDMIVPLEMYMCYTYICVIHRWCLLAFSNRFEEIDFLVNIVKRLI